MTFGGARALLGAELGEAARFRVLLGSARAPCLGDFLERRDPDQRAFQHRPWQEPQHQP